MSGIRATAALRAMGDVDGLPSLACGADWWPLRLYKRANTSG